MRIYQEIEAKEYGIYERFMGKGILQDGIVWMFNHLDNPEKAIMKWNERRKRINFNNIAVIMILHTWHEVEQFEILPIKKKIGFFYEKTDDKNIVYIPGWDNMDTRHKYMYQWGQYVQKHVLKANGGVSPVNWIKFLNGDRDYMRVIQR